MAEATGLTSGATTALIDRLERAGYVERIADPADRRRYRFASARTR
ncbi:MarR family transcriptional regulator (plasmid) [Sinorhizobium garamanticum]|uniref:MarR family transcriptional regulator n=1 Tax=Sinorhizobium garamanticum TaxID=680247 RepID=A0ABY8DLQ2_9HYPH|nr:MarR family transcriptional regulator [Sinorhizobium garamanticum]WEX91820.1 MarR family transcriptional regulator [Sinorhizobium garamanticum]